MAAIEKARIIRDAVLGTEDDVVWTTLLADGMEHAAWVVNGDGWHALVSNLWDLHVAACSKSGDRPNLRENVIGHELLEVIVDGETVLSLIYEYDGDYEQLVELVEGPWEGLFGLPYEAHGTLKRAA